jgi:hypothetical protein
MRRLAGIRPIVGKPTPILHKKQIAGLIPTRHISPIIRQTQRREITAEGFSKWLVTVMIAMAMLFGAIGHAWA